MTSLPKPLALVFCGSRDGSDAAFVTQAALLGSSLAESGWGLCYGGGTVGTMGALANAVLRGGGPVIGIIPTALIPASSTLTPGTIVVDDMFCRKKEMIRRSEAIVCMPGGLGTFDELFEVLTLYQLGVHRKKIILLNTNDFFAPFMALVAGIVANGFAGDDVLRYFCVCPTPKDVIRCLKEFEPALGCTTLNWGKEQL